MGFFDRLFGTSESNDRAAPRGQRGGPPPSPDAQAVERYRYMMRTAPPETIEQAHQEAFTKLTPEQRSQVLGEMAQAAPPAERAQVEATSTDDPQALARVATRTEIRQPGTMERVLSRPSAGMGMGMGGSLLSSFAMGFVGSMVAQSFFSAMGGFGDEGTSEAAGDEGATAENDAADTAGDPNSDFGGDAGGFDGGDFDV